MLVHALQVPAEALSSDFEREWGCHRYEMHMLFINLTLQHSCHTVLSLTMRALPGHDARHNSARFAAVAAAVFITQGVRVHLFSTHVPTPYVAAAVAELGAACGVMVTGK